MHMFKTQARWLAPTAIAAIAVAAVVTFGTQRDATAQADGGITVGTYDQEAVFQQHPANEELQAFYQEVQQQMQQAGQENPQQMQQIRQQVETKRQEAIQDFQTSVSEALPKVADEAGVQIVALQVMYSADGIQTADLTEELTEAVSD